jgi:hypothetical protein
MMISGLALPTKAAHIYVYLTPCRHIMSELLPDIASVTTVSMVTYAQGWLLYDSCTMLLRSVVYTL